MRNIERATVQVSETTLVETIFSACRGNTDFSSRTVGDLNVSFYRLLNDERRATVHTHCLRTLGCAVVDRFDC